MPQQLYVRVARVRFETKLLGRDRIERMADALCGGCTQDFG